MNKTDCSKPNKKKSRLAGASIFLVVVAFFSSLLSNFVLTASMLGIAAILGLFGFIIILKNRDRLTGIKKAIAGIVLSLFLLICGVYTYYASALVNAIEVGNIPKIKQLVAKGYNVNAPSGGGQNMLTLCFWYGTRKISVFRDTPQSSLMTPEEHEDKIYSMLEILVDNGANINALDPHNQAPLHRAAERGYNRIVKMLVKKGADVNLKDGSGDHPLNVAAGYPLNSEMVQFLIKSGADINAKAANGNTPLHNSVHSGSTEVTETLLKNGADVNVKNNDGKTPLSLALQDNNRTKEVELLREYGAKE